jgi:hypothetical protein
MRMIIIAVILWGAPAAARTPRIDVIAKLVEAPPGPNICGVLSTRAVVRYEVIEVKSGVYGSKDLFVVLTCPEGSRPGRIDRLVLEPVRANDSFDDRFASQATRYRALRMRTLTRATKTPDRNRSTGSR